MNNLFGVTTFSKSIIKEAKGSYVWDTTGKRLMDLNSGQFCTLFGHSYEPLNEAIYEQIKKVTHTNTMQLAESVIEAADLVASIHSEGLNKTIFLSTGAEANECALRYAKFITGKNKVLSLDKGYHGLTLETQSITMGGEWARPLVPGSINVLTPDVLYKPEDVTEEAFIEICINDLKAKIKANEGEIAAFMLEPILGAGGMIILPKTYIEAARELCTQNNILMIMDECQTGFGRTGHWFAYQYYNVIPDIVVTAKAMGAGFPVAAATFNENIVKSVEWKISHFSSHQNDPLPCAIVSFVIKTINKENLLEQNKEKGKYFVEALKRIEKETPLLINGRGVGFMIAFDIPEAYLGPNRELCKAIIDRLEEKGVILQAIRKGLTFRILPNYMTTYEEIDEFISILLETLKELESDFIK